MGEEDSSSFISSCVFGTSSFALRPCPPPPKMIGYDEGTYSATYVYARVKAGNEPAGDRPGAGEIQVRSCDTGSSVKSSKIRKSRHLRKFQTMISSSIRKLHYGPL